MKYEPFNASLYLHDIDQTIDGIIEMYVHRFQLY